jgi:hypothetical protein
MHFLPFLNHTAGRLIRCLGRALALALLVSCWSGSPVRAEDTINWDRALLLPRDFVGEYSTGLGDLGNRANRIRLFRIAPGFLSDPVGLDEDRPFADPVVPSFNALAMGTPYVPKPPDDAGPDWLNLTIGRDNPFFDIRRPGDPGGVGYYKLASQMQLLDTRSTAFTLGLQAVKPAGLDVAGLEDGPIVVSPSLCLFHELDNGMVIQSFVGKNVDLNNTNSTLRVGGRMNNKVQYGVSLQQPLFEPTPDNTNNWYVFVEALGRYHYHATASGSPPALWDVLPGVQWRLTDTMSLTGGLVVPLGNRNDPGHWQFTCSFQF